jgi:hypothetical protein
MTEYTLTLVIVPKDEPTHDGVVPGLPSGAELCAMAQDGLASLTKHDARLGWRITEVTT